jgi:hypothetical protein
MCRSFSITLLAWQRAGVVNDADWFARRRHAYLVFAANGFGICGRDRRQPHRVHGLGSGQSKEEWNRRLHKSLRLSNVHYISRLRTRAKVRGDRARRPMSTFPKRHSNYMQFQEEPQQLDLFSWQAGSESPPTGWSLASPVCNGIASVAQVCYSLNTAQKHHVRNLIVHSCGSQAVDPSWYDYLVGLASTMSFLPTPFEHTFNRSDRMAQASDWACVQEDINKVWQGVTTAERCCNERQWREKRGWGERQTAE